jgi:hypothetical protein
MAENWNSLITSSEVSKVKFVKNLSSGTGSINRSQKNRLDRHDLHIRCSRYLSKTSTKFIGKPENYTKAAH